MNEIPNRFYYILPLRNLTELMVEECDYISRDTLRYSIRPIKKQFYVMLRFTGENCEPKYMKPFEKFLHSEILAEFDGNPDWDYHYMAATMDHVTFQKRIWNLCEKSYFIQAYGEVYIVVFKILKSLLLIHNLKHIDRDKSKWEIFNNKFDKANETTIQSFCYFFDVITKEQHDVIHEFRIQRNLLTHNLTTDKDTEQWKEVLRQVLPVIEQISNSH